MNLREFTKHFGQICAASSPALSLEPGKLYAVIGANGSGKSTFSRVVSGVLPADQGQPVVPPSLSVGYLPQKSYGYHMTVQKNLLLVRNDTQRASRLMKAMQLTHLAGKPAHRLSGGETARMALARLMMKDYDLVILDEPTASMDMESTILSEQSIRQYLHETGCTLLLVTHSLQQARRLADYALFFWKGSLLESGPAEQLLYYPIHQETRNFLAFYGT